MSQRIRRGVRRVDSSAVQGDGTWVDIKAMTWGEVKAIRAEAKDADDEARIGMSDDRLRAQILDWNWVDFDGEPLPTPLEDPSVIDALTDEEVGWLLGVLNAQGSPDPK